MAMAKPDLPLPWLTTDMEVYDGEPPSEVNILLLGESGVGKSTFINSFANYMKHRNFEAVQGNNLRVLIPARFHIFDKFFKKHLIQIGSNDDQNECLEAGAAATQDVKTYVFYITLDEKNYIVRLIDTPGMGDPRGIHQDDKNCEYVLDYLGKLQKVHAICMLFNPTNTRLNVFLNYCVTQILSRLERSATQNICFIFTNTRGQNYTPGETYTSLEVLVEKIKVTNNVSIPLSYENVFCFDNEAFRFLAAVKQGVEFREGILEANIESWKYSYSEVWRLLSYISQLRPHDPQKTISINQARKMVLHLAQPLAEIVQLIGDNIYKLTQHTNQLLAENQTLEELKKNMYMPVIDLKVTTLGQPVTVCTAPGCATTYKVAGRNKFHYKQRCHNPCYLNNVPAEIIGDPKLMQCAAMGGTQSCQICNCRFNVHMHVYYETETYETNIVDENVVKNIHTKEDATKEKERMINQICDHKDQLELEHTFIIKCSAGFAHFLQKNAITAINDSLKEYIKYLITREESLGPELSQDNLNYYRRILQEYEEQKSILETAFQASTSSATSSGSFNSPRVVENNIEELFKLKHFGKKIKELFDLHQQEGLREHRRSETVVREVYRLSFYGKTKSYVASKVTGVLKAISYHDNTSKNKKNKGTNHKNFKELTDYEEPAYVENSSNRGQSLNTYSEHTAFKQQQSNNKTNKKNSNAKEHKEISSSPNDSSGSSGLNKENCVSELIDVQSTPVPGTNSCFENSAEQTNFKQQESNINNTTKKEENGNDNKEVWEISSPTNISSDVEGIVSDFEVVKLPSDHDI